MIVISEELVEISEKETGVIRTSERKNILRSRTFQCDHPHEVQALLVARRHLPDSIETKSVEPEPVQEPGLKKLLSYFID